MKGKKLFLLDGCGALLSVFLLSFVLVQFSEIIGMPSSSLYFLAVFPFLFSIYDCYAFRASAQRTSVLLKGIAIINWSYCLISITTVLFHLDTITVLGWIYFVAEILIVGILGVFEWRESKRIFRG